MLTPKKVPQREWGIKSLHVAVTLSTISFIVATTTNPFLVHSVVIGNIPTKFFCFSLFTVTALL